MHNVLSSSGELWNLVRAGPATSSSVWFRHSRTGDSLDRVIILNELSHSLAYELNSMHNGRRREPEEESRTPGSDHDLL
jgi:hypothetical protein